MKIEGDVTVSVNLRLLPDGVRFAGYHTSRQDSVSETSALPEIAQALALLLKADLESRVAPRQNGK